MSNEARDGGDASPPMRPTDAPVRPGPSAPDGPSDPLMDALWSRVMEAWDDDKPHHALLEYAILQQKLPEIAGRYRAVKDGDPARSARAGKKLDGIVVAATQLLMAMKTPASPTRVPAWITVAAFAVCLSLIGWVAALVFRR